MLKIVLQEALGRFSHRPGAAMRATFFGTLVALSSLLSAPVSAQNGMPTEAQRLPVTGLRAGMHLIQAEIAQTPREHAIGLMFRTEMGANEGMIFAFPKEAKQCFWMKNTLIPLAVAFVDDKGEIVNLDEMQAQTEAPHCSTRPVRFVLEMNKGWFIKHGIKVGMKLAGAPFGAAH